MAELMECYTVRLPKSIKKLIRVLAAERECTQQELIIKLIEKEKSRHE